MFIQVRKQDPYVEYVDYGFHVGSVAGEDDPFVSPGQFLDSVQLRAVPHADEGDIVPLPVDLHRGVDQRIIILLVFETRHHSGDVSGLDMELLPDRVLVLQGPDPPEIEAIMDHIALPLRDVIRFEAGVGVRLDDIRKGKRQK